MNISEEKEYLYQTMKLLLEERRGISDELLEIRKRINKLTDFQELGINDIPAIDYISLRQSLNEKKYDTVRNATKIAHDAYKKSMEISTPKEYNDTPQKEEEKNHIIIEESQKTEEKPSFKDTWEDIKLNKQEEIKKPIIREKSYKKKKPSHERIETIVVNFLKESGTPKDTTTIREHIEEVLDYTFTGSNYSQAMWRIKKENEKVESPQRGFYQYKL